MATVIIRPNSEGDSGKGFITAASWLLEAATLGPHAYTANVEDIAFRISLSQTPGITSGVDFSQPGTYHFEGPVLARATEGWGPALGVFTVNLDGYLTVDLQGGYSFEGSVNGGWDLYDFDPHDRGVGGNGLELIGMLVAPRASNPVIIYGTQDVKGQGTLTDRDPGHHCFPAGTPILMANGLELPIEAVRPGDTVVACFDPKQAPDSALLLRRVVNVFHNITDTWIRLSNGVVVTPGHNFLDAMGGSRLFKSILDTDGIIVLADGSQERVTGGYVRFSEQTRSLGRRRVTLPRRWATGSRTGLQAGLEDLQL